MSNDDTFQTNTIVVQVQSNRLGHFSKEAQNSHHLINLTFNFITESLIQNLTSHPTNLTMTSAGGQSEVNTILLENS